ncbi:MAG: uroporphyrinogen decarboxylase family protein [Mangrovibacterium sp.]
MNSRERVLTALKRTGKPDKTPFEISWGAFTPKLTKTYREKTGSTLPPEEYFDFDTRFVLPGPSKQKTDFTKFFDKNLLDGNVTFDEWGIGSVPTLYEIPDFKFHPLEKMATVEEINNYPWPDLGEAYRYTEVAEKTREFQKRGYAVCGELYQTIFETAWLMRNMESFMVDLLLNEETAHAICENITRIRIKQARLFTQAGVDIIRLGDDIVSQRGLMMSREIYDTFFKDRIRQIIQAAKEVNPDVIIFMHSCGKVEEAIDDFIEAGVEVLNPIQPECNDLSLIYRKYNGRLSFWGGIGVQSVMPNGTPEEVASKVRETNNLLGENGGFLIAPAHILDPAIPWDNIVAFVDAAKKL